MNSYMSIQEDLFSLFNSNSWKAENIKTFPNNFTAVDAGSEFIRASIISSGTGINLKSKSGVLLIDIFTSAGSGPKSASLIADKLDKYFVGKTLSTHSGAVTQFSNSSFDFRGLDKDNPTLYRSGYTIPFNYFGNQ